MGVDNIGMDEGAFEYSKEILMHEIRDHKFAWRNWPSFNIFTYFIQNNKNWVGVQRGQSYLMEKRCLFSLGWPPFQWWCHNKNTLWRRSVITSTIFAPHEPANLVTFTEEILNGKLHFLCNGNSVTNFPQPIIHSLLFLICNKACYGIFCLYTHFFVFIPGLT